MNISSIGLGAIALFSATTARFVCANEANPSNPSVKSGNGLDGNWNQTVEIPAVQNPNGGIELHASIVRLSVEQGWLVVRRARKTGEVEWEVVLAQAASDQPPRVEVRPDLGSLALRYGNYFIRENSGGLRILREPKNEASPSFPSLFAEKERTRIGASRSLLNDMLGWRSNDAIWVESGPRQHNDVVLRLTSAGLPGNGTGFIGRQELLEMFYGDARAYDEGDLFTAERALPGWIDRAQRANKLREWAQTGPPPLVTTRILNGPDDLNIEGLRGRAVLLDFWGTWCTPCVANLPHVQELAAKYKDRGLVVVGIHTPHGSEGLDKFLKQKGIEFTVVVDKGETARAYGVRGWPTYFLIDKAGKVAWGFSGIPPTEEQIEKILK